MNDRTDLQPASPLIHATSLTTTVAGKALEELLAESFRIERDDAEAMLPRIWELEGQAKAIEHELGELKAKVKRALEQDAMPLVGTLPDEVTKVTAYLKEVRNKSVIDLKSFAEHPDNEHHILEAARLDLLDVRLTALRPHRGRAAFADALLAVINDGGVRNDLKIERVK